MRRVCRGITPSRISKHSSALLTAFFFNDTATTEIYTTANTLSLHDALPISSPTSPALPTNASCWPIRRHRSEEHTSELQSLAVISYAVFCLKKKTGRAPFRLAQLVKFPQVREKGLLPR